VLLTSRTTFGVVIGTAECRASSCSSGARPQAPSRRHYALVERHLEGEIARHEQIAEEVERASEPEEDVASPEGGTRVLASETPGR
jgi:hypothetical protein